MLANFVKMLYSSATRFISFLSNAVKYSATIDRVTKDSLDTKQVCTSLFINIFQLLKENIYTAFIYTLWKGYARSGHWTCYRCSILCKSNHVLPRREQRWRR